MSEYDELMLCLYKLTRLLWMMLIPFAFLTGFFMAVLISLVVAIRFWLKHVKSTQRTRDARPSIAFFHPNCNADWGAERVLWWAVRALQNRYPDILVVVYTGIHGMTAPQIIESTRVRFNVVLPRPVQFVFLESNFLVKPGLFLHSSLIGQAAGSIVLAWEALTKFVPDVYIDSVGCAFTMPVFRLLGGCRVGSYILSPSINTDMFSIVNEQMLRFGNRHVFPNNLFTNTFKVMYYTLFGLLYAIAGSCCELIMVSSSWTLNQIRFLWRSFNPTIVVYPPCDINSFLDIPLDGDGDKKGYSIVSIGQFSEEKDHRLQIKAFKKVLNKTKQDLKLVLIGGCKTYEDEDRVRMLRGLCFELGVGDKVKIKVNLPFDELKKEIAEATIGLHTMRNEPFGIGIVTLMAAGKIIVAHKSGGPKLDIVVPFEGGQTGFLADNMNSYVSALEHVLRLSPERRLQIRRNARQSVLRFSHEEFDACFLTAMESLVERIW